MAHRIWLFAAALLAVAPPALAKDGWPAEVAAVYKVTFNGFEIGNFRFTSKLDGEKYTLEGSSKLSVVLGAFKWRGVFKSTGAIGEDGAEPTAYDFGYRSGSKRGSVKMTLDGGGISRVALDPPKEPSRSTVPLKPEHMRNVVDPLSAIMGLTRHDSGDPCRRKLAVFDGQRRFDLALSRAPGQGPRARSGGIYVCRIAYAPVAGHKANKENKALSEGVIEVVMRHVPDANLLAPSKITIPTAWGQAVLTSKRFDIVTAERKRIALKD